MALLVRVAELSTGPLARVYWAAAVPARPVGRRRSRRQRAGHAGARMPNSTRLACDGHRPGRGGPLARHAARDEELHFLSLPDIFAPRTAINHTPATLRNNLACGVGSDRIQPRTASGPCGAARVGDIRDQEWYSRQAAARSVQRKPAALAVARAPPRRRRGLGHIEAVASDGKALHDRPLRTVRPGSSAARQGTPGRLNG